MTLNLSANYTLANDVDMGELANAHGLWNITTGFVPIGGELAPFNGTFDGNGHTIAGLTINQPNSNYIGLFASLGTATIQDVNLSGVDIVGGTQVGALAGANYNGTVSNVSSSGTVSGNIAVGGLIGVNGGPLNVGGGQAVVQQSYSAVNVTGAVTGSGYFAGGLVGENASLITQSFATGLVTSSLSNPYPAYIGGLVGHNDSGTIEASYATGSVTSQNYAGGLVGIGGGANNGIIEQSYSTGAVNVAAGAQYSGGFL